MMRSHIPAINPRTFGHFSVMINYVHEMTRMANLSLPMSFARRATGLRYCVKSRYASMRMSIKLLISANAGATGNDVTNKVQNPNWITNQARQNNTTEVVSFDGTNDPMH
jgi:hypothetical protein